MVVAAILAAAIYMLYQQDNSYHILDLNIGNLLLAVMSAISFRTITSALASKDTQRLMRAKMVSLMMKFFIGIIALLGYLFYHHRVIENKGNLFVLLGLYVVYTALETGFLSTKARKKQHG